MVINDPGVDAGLQAGISLTAFFHRIAMRKQRLNLKGAGCEQIQKRLHVPFFCPANETDRIILAPFFVSWIIAARPIGSRHRQRDLFPEHIAPRYAHANVANNGDAPPVP